MRLTEPTVRVAVCRVLNGNAARADADDVVQRVWLRALRHGAGAHRRLVGWLVRTARREALMTAGYVEADRPRARADRRSIGGLTLTVGMVDMSPGPDELADQRRTLRRVRAAANLLTLHEREAFWLGVIDGEPDDSGSSTRRVLAHTARAKLRRVV